MVGMFRGKFKGGQTTLKMTYPTNTIKRESITLSAGINAEID